MVGRYQAARADPYLASRLYLADKGITDPTVDQEAWALLECEFKLKVIHALSGKK